jgi:uncharacterized membrane protein YfcA
MLTLGFQIDIRYAAGASLAAVIATSSGAASAYVREGYTNIRIGMFLEMATTSGAICGAMLAARMPADVISVIFGVMLLFSAWMNLRPRPRRLAAGGSGNLARRLRMPGSYPAFGPDGPRQSYGVRNVPGGFALMGLAGLLSGLLGVGSGAMKVLAMDQLMRLPFKVSTTTSNFMIGVTAAASAGVYLRRGYIDPGLAMPVMLGVLAGSLLGAKLLVRIRTRALRWIFSAVIVALAFQMIVGGLRAKP